MLLCKQPVKHKTISVFVCNLLFFCRLFVLPSFRSLSHLPPTRTCTPCFLPLLFSSYLLILVPSFKLLRIKQQRAPIG